MSANETKILNKILKLLTKFVEYEINGKQFKDKYEEIWHANLDVKMQDEVKDLVDILHSDVDCFESNPKLLKELRNQKDEMSKLYLDENQLRNLAKKKLKKLKEFID